MPYNPRGKRYKVNVKNPLGYGICDKTQFIMRHCDMVKQMEYLGDSLQWTGYMVGKWYADKPNPSLKPVVLKPDPVPLDNPRPQQQQPDSLPYKATAAILNSIYFGA